MNKVVAMPQTSHLDPAYSRAAAKLEAEKGAEAFAEELDAARFEAEMEDMEREAKAAANRQIGERDHRDAIAIQAVWDARQHNPNRQGRPWNGFEAATAFRIIAPALHALAGRPRRSERIIPPSTESLMGEASPRRIDSAIEDGIAKLALAGEQIEEIVAEANAPAEEDLVDGPPSDG